MIQDIHPHLFSNKYITGTPKHENDYIFHFKENYLLLKQVDDKYEVPKRKELKECSSESIFLFTLNNINCFLVWDCAAPEESNFDYYEIAFLRTISQKELDWSCSVAFHLMIWYTHNKFCGKCGTPTEHKSDERALLCASCKTVIYPKVSPAIIVAILCNNKILLAKGANFQNNMYSLVAGYVDVGESIEDAVKREVKEEVGLNIKNISYYSSQPWPFSGSMMIGFIAEAEENQTIKIDGKEIVDAAWFTRDNLPYYPPQRSIAGEIIEKFVQGKL